MIPLKLRDWALSRCFNFKVCLQVLGTHQRANSPSETSKASLLTPMLSQTFFEKSSAGTGYTSAADI